MARPLKWGKVDEHINPEKGNAECSVQNGEWREEGAGVYRDESCSRSGFRRVGAVVILYLPFGSMLVED